MYQAHLSGNALKAVLTLQHEQKGLVIYGRPYPSRLADS